MTVSQQRAASRRRIGATQTARAHRVAAEQASSTPIVPAKHRSSAISSNFWTVDCVLTAPLHPPQTSPPRDPKTVDLAAYYSTRKLAPPLMSRDRALRGRDFRYQIDVRNPSARIPFSFTRERTATRLRAFSRSPHCFATFSTSEADTPLEHSDPRTDQLVGVATTRDSTRMVEHRRDFKGVETVGARTQMQSLDEFSRTSCCRFTRPAARRACIIATSHVVTFERGRTRTTSCAGSSRDAELFRQQARHERSSRRALSRGHSRRSSRYTRSRTRRPRDRYRFVIETSRDNPMSGARARGSTIRAVVRHFDAASALPTP